MQVLSISSQVAWAPVGNSVAVPAMMQKGFEVIGLPTVLLSNHPGHGAPEGMKLSADILARMLTRLETMGALANLKGILTGYFAHPEQVEVMAQFIVRHPSALYLCDPVIGDDPKGLYVPEAIAEAIRDQLLPLAHITTPNRFEAEWLGPLSVKERILTSIPDGNGLITRLETENLSLTHRSFIRDQVPHGTGDLLSGLYLAARLRDGPAQAFHVAMAKLEAVIARSSGLQGLVLSP
jgi:pyridoxine kinase